ncbi:MAG: hypothetical protein M0Z42_12620 [Actinomycetota bacterium]|nr:hypothetical protein [Actinomycetota bacterium]
MVSGDGFAFKVYGDDRMFNEGASNGVAHSGETARMSRNAIVNIINSGKDEGVTVKGIMGRLPNRVTYDLPDGSKHTDPIEVWHNTNQEGALKDLCFKEIFKSMNWKIAQKLVPGINGRLGKTMLTAKPPHPIF